MADTKVYDLVVTVGSYVTRDGTEKKNYKTIGSVFEGKNGLYAVMDKTFNPAGVPSDRSSIFVNFYTPRDRMQSSASPAPQNQPPASFDDDLPF